MTSTDTPAQPADHTSPAESGTDRTSTVAAPSAPTDSTPTDSTPTDSTPTDSTPTDSTPTDSTPTDSTPTDSTPHALTAGATGTGPTRAALVRSRTDRYVGGVCGGLAVHLGVDVTLLRVLMVVLAIVGNLITVPLYLACWVIMPQEQPTTAAA